MKNSETLYTVGLWTAKPGLEQSFIAEWRTFAQWTAQSQPRAGRGILLQDHEHPRKFVSLGPWESADAVNAWRESAEFKAFGRKVRELCDDFQPGSFILVAASDE